MSDCVGSGTVPVTMGFYRNGVLEWKTKTQEFKVGDHLFFRVFTYTQEEFENAGGYIP